MNKELKKVIFTTILVAMAITLDIVISIIPGLNLSMPMGGKFFGIQMIPLLLIGLLFGLKYGLLSSFIYAIYNFSFDYLIYLSSLTYLFSLSFWSIIGIIFFDYILAFTAFGLSGLFKDESLSFKKILWSSLLVSFIRLISSTISGVILWGSGIKAAVSSNDPNYQSLINLFEFLNNNLFLYSLIYNLTYILTTFIVVIIIFYIIKDSLKAIFDRVINTSVE